MTNPTTSDNAVESSSGALTWTAPEYVRRPKSVRWYAIAAALLSIMVAYALFTESPIMAITFILIGFTGYLVFEKEPADLSFAITQEGIRADREFYEFENIHSFSIVRQNDGTSSISLHTDADIVPYVRIPLGGQDAEVFRDILSDYLEEKKHPVRLVDILHDFF
jgi:hypothetical protein